jgi:hypothetical protein
MEKNPCLHWTNVEPGQLWQLLTKQWRAKQWADGKTKQWVLLHTRVAWALEVLSPSRIEAMTMPLLSLLGSCWCSQTSPLLLWAAPSIFWLDVPASWWNDLHQIYPQKHCRKQFYHFSTILKCLPSNRCPLNNVKNKMTTHQQITANKSVADTRK